MSTEYTPKTPGTVTTCTRKIGHNRDKARLWIEGVVLSSQKWDKGTLYIRDDYPTSGIVQFTRLDDAGVVAAPAAGYKARRVAGDANRPIIDTNTDTLLTVLDVKVGDVVHITLTPEHIVIRKFNPATDGKPEEMKGKH